MTLPKWGRVIASGVAWGVVVVASGPSFADATCAEPEMTDCKKAPLGLQGLVPDIDVLKTPTSPALSLVGGAPVDIERPSTPQGAAASLATGIVHGLLTPGNTAAIEVQPYWLFDHPLLSQDDVEKSRDWSFGRDLAISFASSPGVDPAKPASSMTAGAITTSGATDTAAMAALLSLGVSTTIWPGSPSGPAHGCMTRISDFMKGDVALRNADEIVFKAAWTKDNPNPGHRVELLFEDGETDEHWNARMKAANEAADAAAKSDVSQTGYIDRYNAALAKWTQAWVAAHGTPDDVVACKGVIGHRVGFVSSMAAAGLLSAPGEDFKQFKHGGTADETAWLTAGYVWLTDTTTPWSLSALATLRMRHMKVVDTALRTSATDYGARVVAAFGHWGFSAQAMRLGVSANGYGSASSWQGGLAVDYHLKTGYWLTATAGSTDLSGIDSWSAATALIRLQYNFARDRLIQTETTATAVGGGSP